MSVCISLRLPPRDFAGLCPSWAFEAWGRSGLPGLAEFQLGPEFWSMLCYLPSRHSLSLGLTFHVRECHVQFWSWRCLWVLHDLLCVIEPVTHSGSPQGQEWALWSDSEFWLGHKGWSLPPVTLVGQCGTWLLLLGFSEHTVNLSFPPWPIHTRKCVVSRCGSCT